MVNVVKKIISEDNMFFYGETYEDDVFTSSWMKFKENLWFLSGIKSILNNNGVNLAEKRYEELSNLIDGDIDNLYYIASLKNEESFKWVASNIAVKLKEDSSFKMNSVISTYRLNIFSEYLTKGKFDKSFAKELFPLISDTKTLPILEDLSIEDYEKYEYEYDWFGNEMKFEHWFDCILAQDKYKIQGDETEVVEIVKNIFNTNQDTVDKIKQGNVKLVNWIVGQCMKELKGKSSPAKVKEMVDNLLKH